MIKIIALGDFHGKFPEKIKNIIKKEEPDLILSTGDYAGIDEWRPLLKKVYKYREKGEDVSIEELLGKKRYKKLLDKDYNQGKGVIEQLNKFNSPVLSVFGNADWYKAKFNDYGKFYEGFMRKLNRVKNIDRLKVKVEKVKVIGFGGYLDPDIYFSDLGRKTIGESKEKNRERKEEYNLEEKKLMKLMKFYPDIVLTHYTPYKCLDVLKGDTVKAFKNKNLGVSIYNRAVKRFKPALLVCGHMHENQGICKLGKTIVVNPGSAKEGKLAIIEFDEEKKKIINIKLVR